MNFFIHKEWVSVLLNDYKKKNTDCLFLEFKGVYAVRETLKLMDDDVICYNDV